MDVLIDALTPTPGAPRYRATYPSATPEQLRETALSDWLDPIPDPPALTRVYRPEPVLVGYPEELSRALWHDQSFGVLDLPA